MHNTKNFCDERTDNCWDLGALSIIFVNPRYSPFNIDVWEGTSGMSADVPRFGLEIYLVSNAILDEYIFKNKFCEIEDLTLFTDRILAK